MPMLQGLKEYVGACMTYPVQCTRCTVCVTLRGEPVDRHSTCPTFQMVDEDVRFRMGESE